MTSAADQNANVIFGAVIDDIDGRRGPRDGDRDRLRRRSAGAGGATETPSLPERRADRPARGEETFEASDEVLDVPSFLRDRKTSEKV